MRLAGELTFVKKRKREDWAPNGEADRAEPWFGQAWQPADRCTDEGRRAVRQVALEYRALAGAAALRLVAGKQWWR